MFGFASCLGACERQTSEEFCAVLMKMVSKECLNT